MALQEAELQEKLKNMNPEELKQFQIQNCIFCHIVRGKVASKKIYEDDKCLAILDINPANPGHILLMPKEHYSIMPLMPEDIIQHLFMIAKQLSAALLRMLNKDSKNANQEEIGTNIFVANGAAAGQKAQHFMIHIIPRMQKDNVNLDLETKQIDEKENESLRKILAAKIAKDFGLKVVEESKEAVEKKAEPKIEKPKIVEAEFKSQKPEVFGTQGNNVSGAQKSKSFSSDLKTSFSSEVKEHVKKTKPPKVKKSKEEKVSLDDIANLVTGRK